MTPSNTLFGLLVALAATRGGEGRSVEVLYDASVNFTCHMQAPDLNLTVPEDLRRIWILPSGEIVDSNTKSHDRVAVLDEGRVLHVKKVDDPDFGIYYCLLYVVPEDRFLSDQHGINLNGAYWGDLFQEYHDNLITGLIAGAVCMLSVGTICFLYNRHQARGDARSEAEKAEKLRATGEGGSQKPMTQYTNVAYVSDAAEESGQKYPAPQPPPQQQEMQNVAGEAGGDSPPSAAVSSEACQVRL